jgi:predicted transcriptional regulator YdeE
MRPDFIQSPGMILAGFSFFGNPFHNAVGWSVENEIGRLWQRFIPFLQEHAELLVPYIIQSDYYYELHIETYETAKTGEYEVFVGCEVNQPVDLWPQISFKHLQPSTYACFTLKGKEITGDWSTLIFEGWLKQSEYESAFPVVIERYDSRYLGVEQVEQSELDVLVPIKLRG